jgi:hypothetical protein
VFDIFISQFAGSIGAGSQSKPAVALCQHLAI